jgi:hypothetical protein
MSDYLGEPIPPGWKQWICAECTAMCNFEAMTFCIHLPCSFAQDEPIGNGGPYTFIVPIGGWPHAD